MSELLAGARAPLAGDAAAQHGSSSSPAAAADHDVADTLLVAASAHSSVSPVQHKQTQQTQQSQTHTQTQQSRKQALQTESSSASAAVAVVASSPRPTPPQSPSTSAAVGLSAPSTPTELPATLKEIIDMKWSGFAKLTMPNGDVFEGNFVNGLREGYGVYEYSNGTHYHGYYLRNKKHGHGKLRYANGDVYEGEFVNDKPNGNGSYVFANGSRYQGEWQDGRQHGHGRFESSSGSSIETYEGEWRLGVYGGYGVLQRASNVYEGEFVDGQPNGQGKSTLADGTTYEGEWRSGQRQGHGVLTLPTGDSWEGEFVANERTQGMLHTAAGDHFDEVWQNGILVSSHRSKAPTKKPSFLAKLRRAFTAGSASPASPASGAAGVPASSPGRDGSPTQRSSRTLSPSAPRPVSSVASAALFERQQSQPQVAAPGDVSERSADRRTLPSLLEVRTGGTGASTSQPSTSRRSAPGSPSASGAPAVQQATESDAVEGVSAAQPAHVLQRLSALQAKLVSSIRENVRLSDALHAVQKERDEAQRMMEMAEEARTETLSDTLALRLAASDAIAQLDAQQQQLDAPARPSASATLQDSLLGAGSPLAAGAAAAGGARGPAHALRTASAGGNENAGALAAKLARALETTLARQTQVMRTLQQRADEHLEERMSADNRGLVLEAERADIDARLHQLNGLLDQYLREKEQLTALNDRLLQSRDADAAEVRREANARVAAARAETEEMRQASAETFARLQDVEHELGLMRDRCATLEDALERKHADHHSMLQSTDSATADLRAECDRLRAQLLDARAMQAKERELAKSMQDQLRKALAAAQKARKSADDRLQELLHRRAAVAAAEDGAYEALGASQRRASGSGGGADDSLVGV